MELSFTIPAVPVAMPRPRATVRHGHATAYNPSTIGKGVDRRPHPAVVFKATAKMALTEAYQGAPLSGPLRLDAVFVFPRTAGQTWKKRPMPRIWHDKKPDRDNLDKTLLDALKGVLYVDDCQVCDGRIEKWIASGDEQPHVLVTVRTLDAA